MTTVSFSGMLQKEGGGALMKKKQDRYCEISFPKFIYYKEKPTEASPVDPQGDIELPGALVVESGPAEFTIKGDHLPKQYKFWANSDEERAQWVNALRKAQEAAGGAPTAGASVGESPSGAATSGGAAAAGSSSKVSEAAAALFAHRVSTEDFEQIRVVGKGTFGIVMQVRKKDTGKVYAMKEMSKEVIEREGLLEHIFAEKAILQRIDHPYIVKLHFAFQTQHKLYLVLDFLSGGEIFHHLSQASTFDVDRTRIYAAQIGSAIAHLHSLNIIYRDLKPENAVLDPDGHVCLTDFGLAKTNVQGAQAAQTFCGTPEYLAPEFLMGTGHGKAVDWWSLGILIYEMLCGIPPFYDENVNTMYEYILQKPLEFPDKEADGVEVPLEAQDLCARLLDRDAAKRMQSLDEFKAHPFFAGMDWDALMQRKIPAPFKPSVEVADNFGEEFTGMSHMMGGDDGRTGAQVPGFTFEGNVPAADNL